MILYPFRLFRLSLFSILFAGLVSQSEAQKQWIDYVETRIGTAPSTTPSAVAHSEAGSELKGQTIPAVGPPHAMTQWTPQTRALETKCIAPYYYNDPKIQGFRGTHWLNGSCVQDYGTLTLMPVSGDLKLSPAERASAYVKQNEIAGPDYYKVLLTDYNIEAEVTGSKRGGLFRFRYNSDMEHFLVAEVNSDEGEGFMEVHPEKREIVGYNPVHRIYQGNGKPAGFSGYFVLKFDTPFSQSGAWRDDVVLPGAKQIKGNGKKDPSGVFVGFGSAARVVTVRIGTSFTSLEAARANLESELEGKSFEDVRMATRQQWNAELSRIEVKTNSETDKIQFYSALYRTKLSPRLYSDVDGSYPSFGGGKPIRQAKGYEYYCDFSMWDTYRAALPLQVLLEPKQSGEMMQSLVDKGEQGGWLPIFPLWNSYTAAMVGDHAIAALADAYIKGIKGFDAAKAYSLMRKNAFEVNKDPKSYESGLGRRALESYLKYNYIPMEDSVWQAFHKREQVSRTLEYAFDDFALSQMAAGLGKKEDEKLLLSRAANYRNVIDPGTGWARGRYADGSWVAPFDQYARRASFITEGSPAQYSFYVPQDVAGLIRSMGGKKSFTSKLDSLFRYGYYWHGNEPGHQIAYLYAYSGEPWKTQREVYKIVHEEYSAEPGGLSGNEDGGQMSAWLVFSMAGFYPVCPGTPFYVLGTPSFNETILKLGEKKFIIKAAGLSSKAIYIQSAKLNGKVYTRPWLSHTDLLKGGTLTLTMGEKPNGIWGAAEKDAPYSMSKATDRK